MVVVQILSLIGTIGLFLYAIKLMSESLQKIAGDTLSNVHKTMTHNSLAAILAGVLISTIVQSTSATMVMLVSFANAGLLTVAQSLAVYLGANLGMTILQWLVAILGFKYFISAFAFPIIAFSLPLMQSNNSRRNSWGEFLLGFALLLLCISLMQQFISPLSESGLTLEFLQVLSSYSLWSVILFALLGLLLTAIVQSSLVTFVLAIYLSCLRLIPFEMSCAIVLGTSIGSCFSSLKAAREANSTAHRVSRGFLFLSILYTLIAVACFYPISSLTTYLASLLDITSFTTFADIAFGIALFKTLNVLINMLLQWPWIKQIEKWLNRIIPDKPERDESFKLRYISNGVMSGTDPMALIQVRKETARYADETYKMFRMLCEMIDEPLGSSHQLELHKRIFEMEEESDKAEMEIADFLNHISHDSLSWDGELLSRNLYKMVDELESIADSICNLSVTLNNKQEQRIFFNKQMNTELHKMLSLTDAALLHMCHVLQLDEIPTNALNKAYNHEDEINNYRNQLRNTMLDSIDLKQIEYTQSSYFMTLVNECEKIGDYCINIVAAACESA